MLTASTLRLIGALSLAAQSYAAVITVTAGTPCATSLSAPSSTYNFSPLGTCGAEPGFNCYGAPSGSCCSTYGYCGSGPEYCGSGCQPEFGDCDEIPIETPPASSSMGLPPDYTAPPVVSSSVLLSVSLSMSGSEVIPVTRSAVCYGYENGQYCF